MRYIKEISDISDIEQEWKKLENGDDMTSFQSFEWNKLLIKEIKKQLIKKILYKISFICSYDDSDNLLMIAPLIIQTKSLKLGFYRMNKGIFLLGERSQSDYMNFIYSLWDDESAEKIIEYVDNKYSTLNWNIHQIQESTAFAGYLLNSKKYKNDDSEKSVYVDAPEDEEEYYKSLSKHTRQNIRTARNRMNKENRVYKNEMYEQINDEKMLNEMLEIHNRRFQIKNGLDKEINFEGKIKKALHRNKEFKNNTMFDAIRNGINTWVRLITIDDKIAGYLCGMKDEHTYYVMQNCFDEKYRDYSPGFLASYELVEEMTKNKNIKKIDFTRGTEEYKYKLGGTECILMNFSSCRSE